MFKKSLKIKIILYFVPLILLTSSAFLFFYLFRSDLVIKEGLTDVGFRLVNDLSYSSQLAVSIDKGFLLQPTFVEAIFEEKEVVFVAVYDSRGNIVISKSKIEIEEQIPKDVLEEISFIKTPIKRVSHGGQQEEIYDFYSPILIGRKSVPGGADIAGNVVGFVRVSLGLEKIGIERKKAIGLGFSITGLVVLLGFLVSILLAGRIVRPIQLFIKGTEEISEGNLDYQIRVKTGDEIEQLSENFDQMTKSLKKSQRQLEDTRDVLEVKVKARTQELQEQAEGLDEQVKTRTQELQERIDELERFHKLTVGRELRMIELKKQIQELEKQIKPSLQKKDIQPLTKKTKKK
jgi:methyl-accepting chemotaxis protein